MVNRVVVGLKESADPRAVRSALLKAGFVEVREPSSLPHVLVATIDLGVTPQDILDEVASMDGVEYAELETIYRAFE
jgi:hypothetical protein